MDVPDHPVLPISKCPGCPELADPAGPWVTMVVDGVRWHYGCMDVRTRLGLPPLDGPTPLERTPPPPPPTPTHLDPVAMARRAARAIRGR